MSIETRIYKGKEEKTMAQYESLTEIDSSIDYSLLDYPNGGITNSQMVDALTCTRLFNAGEVFVCIDNGTYLKGHIYKIVINSNVKSWEDITDSGATIKDIGQYQYTHQGTILPAIDVDMCREIYNKYTSGNLLLLKWILYGTENYLQIVSADVIAGEYSFDVLIHNQFHCAYSWNANSTGIINPSVMSSEVSWGGIVGNLTSQTDLNNALNSKEDKSNKVNSISSSSTNNEYPSALSVYNFALPKSTKYGASIEMSIDSTTYIITTTLKDQDGNTLGQAQTIDLPLESVVVNGSYDNTTKKVILTLKNGSTIEFSVADLVSGLATTTEVNAKYTKPTNGIPATDLASSVQTSLGLANTSVQDNNYVHTDNNFTNTYKSNIETNNAKVSNVQSDWNSSSGLSAILNKPTLSTVATTGNYQDLSNKPTSVDGLGGGTITSNVSVTGNVTGNKFIGGIEYLTEAPTSVNNDGIKFVVLEAPPSTYYDGYYYIILE